MSTGKISLTHAALVALAMMGCAVGCNTAPPKQAGCPSGTVEKEGSCVPPDDSSGGGTGDTSGSGSGSSGSGSSGSSGSAASGSGSSASGSSGSGSSGGSTASGDKVPYDKQMVDQKLKRAATQVNAHCGSATEEDGKRHGPWGKTKVTVTIDNNGHSRDTTIPAPFDGTAVGRCATNAFNNFQFPPFNAGDQKVDVDVELVKPADEK